MRLHMRDEKGNPTADLQICRRVIQAIKEKYPNIIFDFPCSVDATEEEEPKPLTLSEVETPPLQPGPMFKESAVVTRTPAQIEVALTFMVERNIVPEIDIRDLSHLANAERLILPKMEKPFYFNIAFGLDGSTHGTPANLFQICGETPRRIEVDVDAHRA